MMDRREFLKSGAGTALVGTALSGISSSTAVAATPKTSAAGTPDILNGYSPEDHRSRLQNIAVCERNIRKCMRKHLITSYLPGQCCYNLGEYPCRKPWDPDEYDERELDRLQGHGIKLIQVFDEWNDSLRLFGGHKLKALNPEGFRRFVDMVHRRRMKIIAYVSSGFIQRTDPDFRPEWSRQGDVLRVGYWHLARCSPASAGWRAYLLPRIVQVLDDYGLDGIYNDCGYVVNARKSQSTPTKDEILAFEETVNHDGALADLLALIYTEVKRRGGILKLHVDAARQPRTGDAKVYDYLWVGEGVRDVDGLRESVKNHRPYVVPCVDLNFAKIENEDEPYLHAIPYMQFPVLQAGRPFTGERAMIPGIEYTLREDDFWMRRCRDAWKYYQANPEGPYAYGQWDSIPGRPETRTAHARWLERYLPLVEEGTWAWLEIGDSSLFTHPLPQNVVASAFANRRLYLVLANYGQSPVELGTLEAYVAVAGSSAKPRKQWRLSRRSLHILQRSV
jgi:hypothetical protein